MEDSNRNYTDECGDHGGRNRSGDPCGRAAGWGTPNDSGRCRKHLGTSPDGSSHEGNDFGKGNDGGAPEGNDNGATHNMTANASKLYKRLPDVEKELVDGWKRSLMADAADAQGYTDAEALPSYFEPIIHRLAMNMIRMTVYAEDWEAENEMKDDVSNPLVNRSVVGRTESGEPLFEYSESVVEKAAARMSRENRQWLKDLTIISSPESDQAEAEQSFAEAIKNAVNPSD